MYNVSDFVSVIENTASLLDELTEIEQKKLDAVQKNRVTFVEDAMKKEQAAILKLRGFEKEREKVQESLGYRDLTFRQILAKAPPDAEAELTVSYRRLEKSMHDFQEVSDCVKNLLEVELHSINSALSAQELSNSSGYEGDGQIRSEKKPVSNKLI